MKSIERTFDALEQSNPLWGSFVIFAATVKQTQPNYRILKYWFNKLVRKDEYLQSEKRQLLDYLKTLIIPRSMYEKVSNLSPVTSKNISSSVPAICQ